MYKEIIDVERKKLGVDYTDVQVNKQKNTFRLACI